MNPYKYTSKTVEEIKQLIKKNDDELQKIWDEDDGNSWEKYKRKCRPYWNDNKELYVAESLIMSKEKILLTPMSELDRDCQVPMEEFIEWCKYGYVTSYDGIGYYATKDEISDLSVDPEAFAEGYIRKDFTHVCWFNK